MHVSKDLKIRPGVVLLIPFTLLILGIAFHCVSFVNDADYYMMRIENSILNIISLLIIVCRWKSFGKLKIVAIVLFILSSAQIYMLLILY